jgi:hypothetical protein
MIGKKFSEELLMIDAVFNFPRGFLWGTATSSHQVEGNNKNNNWHAWEQGDGNIIEGQKCGLACDWWNGRWRRISIGQLKADRTHIDFPLSGVVCSLHWIAGMKKHSIDIWI